MAQGAALDERLGELRHLDGRHHPRGHADGFERVHHRERVDDRREHPHGVARHAVDALTRARQPTEDVAAAQNDADLAPQRVDLLDALGHERQMLGVDALARLLVAQNLSREFQKDAAVFQRRCFPVHNEYFTISSPEKSTF